jgi:serine/threonine-protein kinase
MANMGTVGKRASIQTGDLIEGRYRILKLLGEGGMGAVFLAEHTLIKRRVAIKILHPHLATDAHVVDCFMNEARAAGMLGHPNIVESTDMGFTAEHVPYIVFEYLEGALLTDEIYRVGGLPTRRAVRIAEQIAHALRAAHDAGIVHRDLKSDNVFLTDRDEVSDHVKVLDFGISRFLQEDKQRGIVMGTPEFMAPEQLAHPEAVDHRADVYALGAMLYEMLGARRIFVPSKEPIELQSQILVEPIPPLNRADVPPGLAALIEQMLAKDPAQRPQSMGAVALALDTYLTRTDGTPVPRRRSQPIMAVKGEDVARDSSTIPRPTGSLNTPVPSSGTPQRLATPMPMKSRPPYGLFAVAGLGLVVGALGLVFGLRSAKDEVAVAPPPPAPAPAAAMPAPPPVPKEPPKVQIQIDSDVATARVVFRRRVAPAPLTTESAASEVIELVEISAPGYKTERYWVTMDRATHLKAHLVKGSGMAEATEEETLVALGEVAAPTPPTATVAKTIERPAAAAVVAAVAPTPAPASAPAAAPTPRKVGRSAAADSDEIASVKTEKPAATSKSARVEPTVASVSAPSEAPALPPAPTPPPAPVEAPKPAVAVQQPAPQPASTEAPRLIAPGVLKSLRVSGGDQIDAPDLVQAQMVRDEHKKTSATVKVCVGTGGEVSSASMLKSSGYPAFDERILNGVRAFRYKSYTVEGRAVPVCSAVMFIYKI